MRLLISPTAHAPIPPPPPFHRVNGRRGVSLGAATALQTGETAASIAATGITTTTSILSALGSTLTIAGLALPVVGIAISALVTVGIAIANCFKGCGQTCIQATQYANQADAILEQNVNAYTSSPIRYQSMQAAALNTFDTTWAALQKACSQPALGSAGQNCITDRQAGACKWKASPGQWNPDGTYTRWGTAGSGTACFNWFSGMRDPIANDPFVQPDPTGAPANSSSTGNSPTTGTTGALTGISSVLSSSVQLGTLSIPVWMLAAAAAAALAMVEA